MSRLSQGEGLATGLGIEIRNQSGRMSKFFLGALVLGLAAVFAAALRPANGPVRLDDEFQIPPCAKAAVKGLAPDVEQAAVFSNGPVCQLGSDMVGPKSKRGGFGWRALISADSSTAVFYSPPKQLNYQGLGQGYDDASARVFTFSPEENDWVQKGDDLIVRNQTQNLDFETINNYGHWGDPIAVSGDGNTVAIGSVFDNLVVVYKFNAAENLWVQSQLKDASKTLLGYNVGLSEDGNTLAVGRVFCDQQTDGLNPPVGCAAVYTFDDATQTWSLKGSLIYRPAGTGESGESMGWRTKLSADGKKLAVSFPYQDVGGLSDAGTAYVYRFDAAQNDWKLMGNGDSFRATEEGEKAGHELAFSGDGNTLAVYSRGYCGIKVGTICDKKGRVRVFSYDGAADRWVQKGPGLLGRKYAGIESAFGYGGISISYDGKRLAVGSKGDLKLISNDASPGAALGRVEIFSFDDGLQSWKQVWTTIRAKDTGAQSSMVSLSADGTTVAVGSPCFGCTDEAVCSTFAFDNWKHQFDLEPASPGIAQEVRGFGMGQVFKVFDGPAATPSQALLDYIEKQEIESGALQNDLEQANIVTYGLIASNVLVLVCASYFAVKRVKGAKGASESSKMVTRVGAV